MGLNLKPPRHARTPLRVPDGTGPIGGAPGVPKPAPIADVHDNVDMSTGMIALDIYSKKVLNRRADRRSLEIQNKTASPVYLNVDGSADEQVSYTIAPGGYFAPPKAPKGAIYIKGTYEGQHVFYSEGW